MAFQSVPNAAEIIVNYSGNSKNMASTMAAVLLGGYSLADLIVLATAVDAAVTANWLPIQTNNYNYISTVVRGLEFENDVETTVDTGAAVGGVVEEALPGNVTYSVKKSSGITGRSARGRMFWIGMVESNLQANENLLTVIASDAIEAAIEAMRVAIDATIWTPVIVSRFNAGLQRPFGIVFNWVATEAVNLNVDSQRRRLIR